MRAIAILALLPLLAGAEEPREIVRHALASDTRNDEIARSYTFLQRQETRRLDGSGRVKKREAVTYDITLLEGSPYRRMVARDDKALPSDEERKEQEKLRKSIEDRKKETPEQRQARIADWNRHRERQREQIRRIPEAFDFTLAGEEVMAGTPVWVIDAMPRRDFKPRTQAERILAKVKGRLWIGKSDYHWQRAELESLDTITFGGVLVRLSKGTTISLDQVHINGEVWMPHHIAVNASARLLLVAGLRLAVDYDYSQYKKFQVESRVVETAPLP